MAIENTSGAPGRATTAPAAGRKKPPTSYGCMCCGAWTTNTRHFDGLEVCVDCTANFGEREAFTRARLIAARFMRATG